MLRAASNRSGWSPARFCPDCEAVFKVHAEGEGAPRFEVAEFVEAGEVPEKARVAYADE